MQGQQTESVATAVQMLAEQNLMAGVRSVALTAPNTFRTDRLYTEEVDLLYKKHLVLLKAIYTAFRRAPNGGGLRLKVSQSCMCTCRQPAHTQHYFAVSQSVVQAAGNEICGI